jgi:hypothetical protein
VGNKYRSESMAAQQAARKLKACESKASYETEDEAMQKGQDHYRCRYCGKWHRSGAFRKLVNQLKRRGK